MKRVLLTLVAGLLIVAGADAKRVKQRSSLDLSVVDVPEEGGVSFERITEDADCVFSRNLVRKGSNILGGKKHVDIDWWVNPQIAVSPDGQRLAYINDKNNATNIMVKYARKGGASTQRTFRTNVEDFTLSPDGSTICFTELRNGHHGVYLVDAVQGNVVRQISNSNDNDFAGKISTDNSNIFFHRGEGINTYSIWSYDRNTNLFSNYSRGMTPCLDPKDPDIIYCARYTNNKESEIWRINVKTGVEEIILSQQARSFTTPQLSPDGKWLLVTGTSKSEKNKRINTDIFAIRTDGTQFTQLTYHPGNDISAVWAPDGRYIFFLSQRGSRDGVYNVWKMEFVL